MGNLKNLKYVCKNIIASHEHSKSNDRILFVEFNIGYIEKLELEF